MDNYGDPIYDKNNNLIGYKINDFEYASVITYYNEDNLLCNKIYIKELNCTIQNKNESLISWLDIKTEKGFIREFDNIKYFYDKDNNLINVKINISCSKFPYHKKNLALNNKIGTLDFETYGSNYGQGYHQVYAGG
jgi:hypothetical protein